MIKSPIILYTVLIWNIYHTLIMVSNQNFKNTLFSDSNSIMRVWVIAETNLSNWIEWIGEKQKW
jgi:hypothetical protein